ncbi:MAG: tRNA (N(6)-L-threonylcarbamoyladenosine(37)-C(2))-methylthiotransferase MtaB [Alicyclobacillaceae bacterium]|uniref:tRNA (N(6)-L-threonylcarbamoyladenosine(37)-C(2))- methylthiotransferase MtaB n=1 Tax=Alicyclobacillus sp. SP_1 TaxID=2942475 RepID=UPI002157C5C4|nr:tRNA (N(6)-L-threonylcarbamoyladenosine(37)-C(2))-methylthiotransferase MtaB [Alicyclobacillus sp. SP_1]MCY0888463.1 tRNA (N(6)-L-threonylcarbamoyladenosine(37)-C(2))-methylthiotransferase MtaB [Alicyclobacillaceae bacterium]
MPRVAFHTLGCKVNFYDTEGIWQQFQSAGYDQVAFDEKADVYVINTCTVTHLGDKKSRQMIRRAIRQNPDGVVVATGCYAQMSPQEIADIPGVDLVVGNDRKSKIVQLVAEVRKEQQTLIDVGNILKSDEFEEFDVPAFGDRTRANLKIQDGCNHFCTFCIIPYARGLIRSRAPERVLSQARKLVDAGYREIVLTGIHTGGYGEDLQNYRLSHLLEDLERMDGLSRIRISSIEASELDDRLIEVMHRSQKICNHLHIPLQSGSNRILKRMNRHYTREFFSEKLARLQVSLPNLAVTSDIIVGFPSESEEDFLETERFIQEHHFSELHVFPYSPRRGTPAAKFPDSVPPDVKAERVQRLLRLSQTCTQSYAEQQRGKMLQVIPEQLLAAHDSDFYRRKFAHIPSSQVVVGHASNYLRVAFVVPTSVDRASIMGEICAVRLLETSSDIQLGEWCGQVSYAEVAEQSRSVMA